MGGDLAQPANPIDSQNLFDAIANFSTDATLAYWIGNFIDAVCIIYLGSTMGKVARWLFLCHY